MRNATTATRATRSTTVVVALLLVVQVLVVAPRARAEGDGFTRLRLTLSTTSDWARASFEGIDIRVEETTSLTAGARHYAKESGWTVVPSVGSEAVAVVDMVVAVPAGAEPLLTLRKGMVGTATVQVDVVNGPDPETVLEEHLTTNDPSLNERRVRLDPTDMGIGGLDVDPVDPRKLTLAFYYPWFGADAPSDPGVAPDDPVRPYATDDPGDVAGMVSQAHSVGVDGFVVSWSGDRHRNSVRLLFDAVAARSDFGVAPVIELRAFRDPNLLLGTRFSPAAAAAATHDFFDLAPPSSTLEVDGRRVAFVFGLWDLSPDEWQAYLAGIADLGLFVIGDRAAGSHPVQGTYDYDPNGLDRSELERRARVAVDQNRLRPIIDPSKPTRLWAATVSPGLDTRSSNLLRLGGRQTSRDGGARYDLTWDVALRAQPDWVLITSWNEWYEQTHVAPGSTTGRRALDQTARWTERF